MKKFTFQRVLDGLRSSVSQQPRPEQEIVETLRPENFQVAKVSLISHKFCDICVCKEINIVENIES